MRKSVLILIVLIFAKEVFSDNYITRGHQPQELYIASHWFQYVDTSTMAIFFTDDYGKSIIMKYYSGWSLNGTYGMPIGRIVSDKTNGVIYNAVMTSLWRSDDFGCTWDSLRALYQTPFLSIAIFWIRDFRLIFMRNNLSSVNKSILATIQIHLLTTLLFQWIWKNRIFTLSNCIL